MRWLKSRDDLYGHARQRFSSITVAICTVRTAVRRYSLYSKIDGDILTQKKKKKHAPQRIHSRFVANKNSKTIKANDAVALTRKNNNKKLIIKINL